MRVSTQNTLILGELSYDIRNTYKLTSEFIINLYLDGFVCFFTIFVGVPGNSETHGNAVQLPILCILAGLPVILSTCNAQM